MQIKCETDISCEEKSITWSKKHITCAQKHYNAKKSLASKQKNNPSDMKYVSSETNVKQMLGFYSSDTYQAMRNQLKWSNW